MLVVCNSAQVLPFVETVRKNADQEKDALGFLPAQAYEDAAASGNLFVALTKDGHYCGHIMFGGTYPHLRVFQVYVPAQFRGSAVGAQLVASVLKLAEQQGFLSVSAKVAEDLDAANKFWQDQEFVTVRKNRGGSSRNRILNVRVRQLNTPTLFGFPEGQRVSRLPICEMDNLRPPVYAVDLNVFFDVVKRRTRCEYAGRVFSAGFKNLVKIVVAEEFVTELRRSSRPNETDPVLELAAQLPTIPVPGPDILNGLTDELAAIVFPHKLGHLTIQDHSDLRHLATAIHHSTTGFVTSERALVNAGEALRSRYGITVIDVQGFSHFVKSTEMRAAPIHARLGAKSLQVCEAAPDLHPAIERLLTDIGIRPEVHGITIWTGVHGSAQRSLVALLDDRALAVMTWNIADAVERVFQARLLADEDHAALSTAIDALLYRFSIEATATGPALLRVTIPCGHVYTCEAAIGHGFRVVDAADKVTVRLERVAIGQPVLPDTWPQLRDKVLNLSGINFATGLPPFTLYDARMGFVAKDGTNGVIGIADLETALAPVVFVLPGRPGVILPIRPVFADHLLGTAQQFSLLPTHGAVTFHERVYYSTPRNASLLTTGSPIIFYESGRDGRGRSAAVALARVVDTSIVPKTAVPLSELNHGVLDENLLEKITVQDDLAVTTFDNVIRLAKPVPLRRLRAIGCADGSNLVSARRVGSEHLSTIVEEGLERAQ